MSTGVCRGKEKEKGGREGGGREGREREGEGNEGNKEGEGQRGRKEEGREEVMKEAREEGREGKGRKEIEEEESRREGRGARTGNTKGKKLFLGPRRNRTPTLRVKCVLGNVCKLAFCRSVSIMGTVGGAWGTHQAYFSLAITLT